MFQRVGSGSSNGSDSFWSSLCTDNSIHHKYGLSAHLIFSASSNSFKHNAAASSSSSSFSLDPWPLINYFNAKYTVNRNRNWSVVALFIQSSPCLKTMTKGAEKELGFFKYIVPVKCTKMMRLPPAHHWNDKDAEFPDKIVLMDQKGNTWLVKLDKVKNRVCFVDGWLKFVRDNNVELDNFIVFENVGSNVYSFLLFDSNTKCETGGFIGLKTPKDEKEDSVIGDQTLALALIRKESEEEEDDPDYDAKEEEEEKEESFDRRENTRTRVGPKDRVPRRTTTTRGVMYRIDNIYEHELFKSGVLPRPKNPYFITRRKATRDNELHIPKNFMKDYNIYLQIDTIMRDNGGAEWATQLNEWSDGRRWYYGGWGNFCRTNHVQQGDYCVCEFIEDAEKGLILFVYKLE